MIATARPRQDEVPGDNNKGILRSDGRTYITVGVIQKAIAQTWFNERHDVSPEDVQAGDISHFPGGVVANYFDPPLTDDELDRLVARWSSCGSLSIRNLFEAALFHNTNEVDSSAVDTQIEISARNIREAAKM